MLNDSKKCFLSNFSTSTVEWDKLFEIDWILISSLKSKPGFLWTLYVASFIHQTKVNSLIELGSIKSISSEFMNFVEIFKILSLKSWMSMPTGFGEMAIELKPLVWLIEIFFSLLRKGMRAGLYLRVGNVLPLIELIF